MSPLRKIIFTTIAIFLGFAAVGVLFTLVEVGARIYTQHFSQAPFQLSLARESVSPHILFDPSMWGYDPVIGSVALPNQIVRSTRKYLNNSMAYDVHYTIDSQGRRKTPHQEDPQRDQSLLFLGCSFTFGEGLEDSETIPAYVSELQQKYRVYNYSLPGWGPNNLYSLIQSKNFGHDLPKQKSRAIYIFIPHHVYRVVGNLNIYRLNPNWPHTLPHFFLDKDGNAIRRGMLSSGRPILNKLFRILVKSEFLKLISVDFPRYFTKDHYRLTAAIIAGMRDELKKVGVEDFTVLAYPHYPHYLPEEFAKLVPFLKERNIHFLDYSKIKISKEIKTRALTSDSHPTAKANRFIAEKIVKDIY